MLLNWLLVQVFLVVSLCYCNTLGVKLSVIGIKSNISRFIINLGLLLILLPALVLTQRCNARTVHMQAQRVGYQ